jgi:hypothetical protein
MVDADIESKIIQARELTDSFAAEATDPGDIEALVKGTPARRYNARVDPISGMRVELLR